LKKVKKLLYIITLVELTGRRSNEFEEDMSGILKTHVASKILI
jgi:hypothetical protein